jgi:hypothetical protein
VLHSDGRAARGERHGEHRPVVVAPGSWLEEEFGAQPVLAVDEMEPDSTGGSLLLVKRSCGGSALWCLLTRQLEDGARSEEGSRA